MERSEEQRNGRRLRVALRSMCLVWTLSIPVIALNGANEATDAYIFRDALRVLQFLVELKGRDVRIGKTKGLHGPEKIHFVTQRGDWGQRGAREGTSRLTSRDSRPGKAVVC